MFNNDFVVAVKKDGQVLRERNNNVFIPFGSNYTILLKNLREEVSAKVDISIDGEDVLNDRSLIVKPNDSIELKRFINSSLDKGNRFKFIEATDKIRDNREDNSMNGLIKVTYRFEKKYGTKEMIEDIFEDNDPYFPDYPYTNDHDIDNYQIRYSVSSSEYTVYKDGVKQETRSANEFSEGEPIRSKTSEGITTYGDVIEQKFSEGNIGKLEDKKNMIVLQLVGRNKEDEKIENTLTTNEKIECSACGRSVSSDFKYCPHCGTSLTVI